MNHLSARWTAILAGCAGILGVLMIGESFHLNNGPPLTSPDSTFLAYAVANRERVLWGAWLQAAGPALIIVLALTLVSLSKATSRVSGLLTIFGAGVLMTTNLMEIACYIAGLFPNPPELPRIANTFGYAVQHLYFFVAAPALSSASRRAAEAERRWPPPRRRSGSGGEGWFEKEGGRCCCCCDGGRVARRCSSKDERDERDRESSSSSSSLPSSPSLSRSALSSSSSSPSSAPSSRSSSPTSPSSSSSVAATARAKAAAPPPSTLLPPPPASPSSSSSSREEEAKDDEEGEVEEALLRCLRLRRRRSLRAVVVRFRSPSPQPISSTSSISRSSTLGPSSTVPSVARLHSRSVGPRSSASTHCM